MQKATNNEKRFLAWLVYLAINQGGLDEFRDKVKVLMVIREEDYNSLVNIFDDLPATLSYRDMQQFITSEEFKEWFEVLLGKVEYEREYDLRILLSNYCPIFLYKELCNRWFKSLL